MSKENTSRGGIGFCGLLAVLFIGLKLAEVGVVSTWTWTWVLSPLWIPLAFWLTVLVFGVVCLGVVAAIEYLIEKKS
jgi:hypothetical protein